MDIRKLGILTVAVTVLSLSGLSDAQPNPVVVGFLQGRPISPWSFGISTWQAPTVRPGDYLLFYWFGETHDVQKLPYYVNYKICSLFNAQPLVGATSFGMKLYKVRSEDAGKHIFFASGVGKDCQRGLKVAIEIS
eukprot:TRINITY_DN25690_c0_g1_i2.p2 TRINITY_DN25690_c0_g1~~TRINITY_DN25690_c0_g1_i2.p2  ORF type:complete len:135 (+),score=0.32 TRINITY_DN25690_c0_g1_i2:119-523(+)